MAEASLCNFWIDTDTASDDAVAIILALRSSGVTVRGISIVAGNIPLMQATRNALFVVELCGGDVPVYAGCEKPMLREAVDATWFHGQDGLSDRGFAPKHRAAESLHAVDALLAASHQHVDLTLVTLGPLTNIAAALLRDPSLAKRISRCVIMGGNPCCVGNVTPAAEYNIWCDPEAAEIVLRSGLPIDLVGWHLCRGDAAWNAREIDEILALDNPIARFAVDCNHTGAEAYRVQTGEIGISLPDPTAMAIAIDPACIVSASSHAVQVDCASALGRGQTIVDQLNVAEDARNSADWKTAGRNIRVVWTMDVPRFKQMLIAALR